MAYRSSTGDFDRTDRWERGRVGEDHVRFEERESDRVVYRRRSPSATRVRDDDRRRDVYEEDIVRERRLYEDDRDRPYPRRPSSPRRGESFERRLTVERERVRSPSPARRPPMLVRRQSSLDTFDRRPRIFHERVEYGPPARRDDYRPQKYVDIPLPRRSTLGPPPPAPPPPAPRGRYERYDEIRVSDPGYYGDEEFRPYPNRVREREVIHTHRRSRSRSLSRSRSRSRASRWTRSSRRSSSRSSSLSSSSKVTVKTSKSVKSVKSVKSEYPKKGKTRIPAKLLSKRAIIELGYPYEEEGSTIIIQLALGQDNIDDLLKLSEDYKKAELEVVAAREPERIIEERREEVVFAPEPTYIEPAPPLYYNPAPPAVENHTLIVRDVSPARSCSTATTTTTATSTSTARTPIIIHAGPPREVSNEIALGPLALAEASHGRHYHHHHHHHRSHSRHHSRHRSLSRGDELVRAERLSDGQLVIYEERLEHIQEPRRGVRIERDRKGPSPAIMKAMLATLT